MTDVIRRSEYAVERMYGERTREISVHTCPGCDKPVGAGNGQRLPDHLRLDHEPDDFPINR